MLDRIWKHKILSALLFLLLFLIVEIISLPLWSIRNLKKQNPQLSALMEQRIEEATNDGRKYVIRREWVPLSRISDDLIHAVIVEEDGTFFEHEGIDWYEVQESIKKDLAKGKFARGASTITQQLAKNLYLSTSKDPLRKVKEIIIAKRLEAVLSKDRILEIYLNVIEWGNGIFGIEAAAMTYFGKHASDLTREESARLASVIPSPLTHQPHTNSRYVQFRTRVVLARLDARGW